MGVALYCWVPVALIVWVSGATTMEVNTGAAAFTVKVALLLVIVPEAAVMALVSVVAPVFLPVARPVALMVAALVLLEAQVKVVGLLMGLPN